MKKKSEVDSLMVRDVKGLAYYFKPRTIREVLPFPHHEKTFCVINTIDNDSLVVKANHEAVTQELISISGTDT